MAKGIKTPHRAKKHRYKSINPNYSKSPIFLNIKKEIPFIPISKQVIYFESHFNDRINEFISSNHDLILEEFKLKGYDFVYIPISVENMDRDIAFYFNPSVVYTEIEKNNLISYESIMNIMLSYMTPPLPDIMNGFIRYKKDMDSVDSYQFSYFVLSGTNEQQIWEQIYNYLSSVGDVHSLYSLSPPKLSEDFADQNFDIYTLKLFDEIQERIDKLRQRGVNMMVIKSLFSLDAPSLSKLVITEDFKIFLPKYNNLEIKMHPLPKSVYILFLNHPKGIMFKDLPDYREELIEIYKNVSGRESIEQMQKSIDDVVNPTLNSINENCSRIRRSFLKHFDERIAENYFIVGKRGLPKMITLDRNLVVVAQVFKSE